MIYCFDLDGTLCSHEDDYNLALPFPDRINKVNILYSEGNTILIDTARGSTTGIDWTELTKNQLSQWGVRYHTLRLGVKLHADIFIDDKAISESDFFKDTFET
jgi:hypothetical protein